MWSAVFGMRGPPLPLRGPYGPARKFISGELFVDALEPGAGVACWAFFYRRDGAGGEDFGGSPPHETRETLSSALGLAGIDHPAAGVLAGGAGHGCLLDSSMRWMRSLW